MGSGIARTVTLALTFKKAGVEPGASPVWKCGAEP
jgi:hypothetical protein